MIEAIFPVTESTFTLGQQAYIDLEVGSLAKALTPRGLGPSQSNSWFSTLMFQGHEIHNRQILLSDLLDNPELSLGLASLLPQWDTLHRAQSRVDRGASTLHRAMGRLSELTAYTELLLGLNRVLSPMESKLRSKVWKNMAELVKKEIQDPGFTRLVQALPHLKKRVPGVQGISIGINLDTKLEPVGVVLLDIHDEPFHGRQNSFLGNLFHSDKSPMGELHTPPFKYQNVAYRKVALDPESHGFAVNPQSIPVFREMGKALEKGALGLEKALIEFRGTKTDTWERSGLEVQNLLGAHDFCQKILKLGLPLVFPQILPMEDNRFECTDLRNLALELSLGPDSRAVANDAVFDDTGRIHVITGPNKGGKTVYLQAVGLAQILFQAGLPVPATQAAMSPVKRIFTHYPLEEKVGRQSGRFGDELVRFKDFFDEPECSSLVLLNESLTGTGAEEAALIAGDILGLLRRLGCRGVFTTHLHTLARDLEELNNTIQGPSRLISLAAQVIMDEGSDTPKSTYKVIPGPPPGRSYARNLARHYGLDFSSIEESLPYLIGKK